MIGEATGPAALPKDIDDVVRSTKVVLVVSPLTDARQVTEWLDEHREPYELVTLSMASAENRETFRQVQQHTHWDRLPQIFIQGRYVGGIEEFFNDPWLRERDVGRETGEATESTIELAGYLGLVPYLILLAVLFTARDPLWHGFALNGILGYGAVILSFVGALHFGRAMVDRFGESYHRVVLSVALAVMAWGALLLPPRWGLATLILGFAVIYSFDRHFWRDFPRFLRLRRVLTIAVVLALFLAWMAA